MLVETEEEWEEGKRSLLSSSSPSLSSCFRCAQMCRKAGSPNPRRSRFGSLFLTPFYFFFVLLSYFYLLFFIRQWTFLLFFISLQFHMFPTDRGMFGTRPFSIKFSRRILKTSWRIWAREPLLSLPLSFYFSLYQSSHTLRVKKIIPSVDKEDN